MGYELDLLDKLQSKVACEYLSDMRLKKECNQAAKEYLKDIQTDDYPVGQWRDAAQYLYDMKMNFQSHDDVDKWRDQLNEDI